LGPAAGGHSGGHPGPGRDRSSSARVSPGNWTSALRATNSLHLEFTRSRSAVRVGTPNCHSIGADLPGLRGRVRRDLMLLSCHAFRCCCLEGDGLTLIPRENDQIGLCFRVDGPDHNSIPRARFNWPDRVGGHIIREGVESWPQPSATRNAAGRSS
jgi:hypothetical protein